MIEYTIKCLNCGKEHTFKRPNCHKERKFCNKSCAVTYNNTKRWEDPKAKEKQSKTLTAIWVDPNRRELQSERARNSWANNYQERVQSYRTEEFRKGARIRSEHRWANPEFKTKTLLTMESIRQTSKYLENLRRGILDSW